MYVCPITGCKLRRARVKGGHIWYSPESGGRLLSIAMVRHFLDEHAAQELWMRAAHAPQDKDKQCPGCDRPMSLVQTPGWVGKSKIDVCRYCYLMWFDKGEHQEIPHPHVDLDRQVQQTEKRVAFKEAQILAEHEKEQDQGIPGEGPEGFLRKIPGFLMLPVELESPSGAGIAFVTLSVFLVSLVFQWQAHGAQHLIELYGFMPKLPLLNNGLNIFLGPLMHVGWLHLLGNFYFFCMFGEDVEEDFGHGRYLLLLVGACIFSAAGLWLLSPYGDLPHIGMGSLVMGHMTYYLLRYPKTRMAYMLPMLQTVAMGRGAWARIRGWRWVRIPSWSVAIFYLIFHWAIQFQIENRQIPVKAGLLSLGLGVAFGLIAFLLRRR